MVLLALLSKFFGQTRRVPRCSRVQRLDFRRRVVSQTVDQEVEVDSEDSPANVELVIPGYDSSENSDSDFAQNYVLEQEQVAKHALCFDIKDKAVLLQLQQLAVLDNC